MLVLSLIAASLFASPMPVYQSEIGSDRRIDSLIRKMTPEEKLGQMSQTSLPRSITPEFRDALLHGRYGSVFGWGDPAVRAEIQRIATKESRLGIPLIIGHDIIHGCTTGFPIPLAQAASWDPELIRQCARVAAKESATLGIRWTFSPMMDIARDPRWGRIAEGYGEDPFLASAMGVATVRGYQGDSLSAPDSIAACGKHFVGYGAAEAGRDYNSTWIPEILLRDVYLKPFRAAKDAGIATYMSAFNAINGVPASANPLTLKQILRKEWGFDGFVVSDYAAIQELIPQGVADSGAEAAQKAIQAGVDMEMITEHYYRNGKQLVATKKLDPRLIDESVRRILRIKFRLGLFDQRFDSAASADQKPTAASLELARRSAIEGLVLLKNEKGTLPLPRRALKYAVIGSLADSKRDELGTWAATNPDTSVTPLEALRTRLGAANVLFAPGVLPPTDTGRDYNRAPYEMLVQKNRSGFEAAIQAAMQSDVVLLFLGEGAGMSGEASSRTDLGLPGAQNELVEELAKLGKPMVGIVMAGRPLIFHDAAARLDAVLYAWHGGPMAGPAIVDMLFGDVSPSGKLPVTFPRVVGQIPIYYDHLNTGRPPTTTVPGTGDRFESKYLDMPYTPEYPFGFGLSYAAFRYSGELVSGSAVSLGGRIAFEADVTNTSHVDADEVVQLYVHQRRASVARPVRELKGFQRIHLKGGETKHVTFSLGTNDLAFTNSQMKEVTEPGKFDAWIAPDSTSGTRLEFEVTPK